jgi:hypothetical protein
MADPKLWAQRLKDVATCEAFEIGVLGGTACRSHRSGTGDSLAPCVQTDA